MPPVTLRRERPVDDRRHRLRDRAEVAAQHDQAGEHVEERHEGHEVVGDLRDALDAADDHDADADGEHDAEQDAGSAPAEEAVVASGHGPHLRGRLVGLEGVAAAQGAEDAEDGEGCGEELAQPAMPCSESPRER